MSEEATGRTKAALRAVKSLPTGVLQLIAEQPLEIRLTALAAACVMASDTDRGTT